jgi:hypothetical protein
LTDSQVGKYMNTHFVSSYQKISNFRINGNKKQGGNVASYFCMPDGTVLHAVAGKVDADEFLREARWAVESWKLAQLVAPDLFRGQALFRKLHTDRLRQDYHLDVSKLLLSPTGSLKTLTPQINRGKGKHRKLDNQGKVHLLLAANPLPRLDQIYTTVFVEILNQRISTAPVMVRSR